MKNIFRQAGIFIIFLGLWYLLFLFLTYLFYPDSGVIEDNQTHRWTALTESIYPDGGANVDLGFWVSKNGPKRIIITGASNAREGILSSVLQGVFPDFTIYNATSGSSNVTQLRQIVDVVSMPSPGAMKGTVFVMGIFYGTFFDDNVPTQHFLWKNRILTKLQADGLRYGLYRPIGDKLALTVAPPMMPWVVRALRPFLFWHIIFLDIKLSYVDFWTSVHSMTGKTEDFKGETLRQDALAKWKVDLGDIKDFAGDAQMHRFVSLCKEIVQSGASLVVVDLPVPQWLRERSEYYKKYTLQRPLYINEIKKMPAVRYLDLGAIVPGCGDLDFRDSAHPTREAAKIWSKAIVDFMVSQGGL
jgi:hypothetical protein